MDLKQLYFICVMACFCTVSFALKRRHRRSRKFKRGYTKKPNIIFIMADDLDVALGSPDVMFKTNRRLRQEGVTFTNAFTTSPLCCPSRSSILTGRYTHNHHVHSNNKNCSGPGWINKEEKETFGNYMQNVGYETAYFGKYLNNYDGKRVPPGWNHWSGLLRNSRYYNYALNINGHIKRYKSDYKKDYFTNVITSSSIEYFTKHITNKPSKPLLMVVSHSAPHGPEDAAPHHQHLFPNITAPRYPNYNLTCPDKHWIIRTTPPLTDITSTFTDMLHRKRLQTLMALDDAIERLYNMLLKTKQLSNTYMIFTSDHGYHLGQFNQVKGKSQPYESDIRIPLYMRGPKIPRGVVVNDIALNIDFAPTFLDIARSKAPKSMDGTSLMDVAVGSIINTVNRKILKPIWKDTFLVERGKMKKIPVSNDDSQTYQIDRLVFPTVRKIQKMCLRNGFPKPPCTPDKKFVCYSKDHTWYLQKCIRDRKLSENEKCSCSNEIKSTNQEGTFNQETYRLRSLLAQLERHFERLKRRIKRHGLKYFETIFNARQKLLEPAIKGMPLNLTKESKRKINVLNKTLSTMWKKQKLQQMLDKTIQNKMKELEYLQKEREKLTKNRIIKMKLEEKLTKKLVKHKTQKNGLSLDNNEVYNFTRSCICQKNKHGVQQKQNRKRKKKNGLTTGRHMNCFHFSKNHWKHEPKWTGPSFTACTNSPNSSYWCLRTINKTHNFLYCEFVTGFKEYFDISKDPYQLKNIIKEIKKEEIKQLHQQLVYMKECRGSKGCFLRSGQSFTNRKDMLRKWRRYERKKRHGIFVRGSLYTSTIKQS